jgi:hypothetical protein
MKILDPFLRKILEYKNAHVLQKVYGTSWNSSWILSLLFLFIFLAVVRGLKSGPCACYAGSLPLEPCHTLGPDFKNLDLDGQA